MFRARACYCIFCAVLGLFLAWLMLFGYAGAAVA